MAEWTFAQSHPSQELAKIQYFSVKNKQGIEFTITVKEFLTPHEPSAKFLASSDKQTNQKTIPFTPTGWGVTLLDALSACIREVDRFPFEG